MNDVDNYHISLTRDYGWRIGISKKNSESFLFKVSEDNSGQWLELYHPSDSLRKEAIEYVNFNSFIDVGEL